jgi:hypothetical protein
MPKLTTAINNTAWKNILLTAGSFQGLVVDGGGPADSSVLTIFLCQVKGLAIEAILTNPVEFSESYNANVLR